MSDQGTYIKSILSPGRCGTFFAPFRSRSANPDGFDSKMKLWIKAIEEWMIQENRIEVCINDIHRFFTAEGGIRPDKECLRLVLSEMRRRSLLVLLKDLKKSEINSSSNDQFNFVDPDGWLGWGFKNFVYSPASWAISMVGSMNKKEPQEYSDLTDLSITDEMQFVCIKSLSFMSRKLYEEFVRISKAENQTCFEWQQLLELITPIINKIIDVDNSRVLLDRLDILIEYLALNKQIAIKTDGDIRLIKIKDQEDDVIITQKDIACARLLKAKEVLISDSERYTKQAQTAREEALRAYDRQEVARAKFLMRTSKRSQEFAQQKDGQLENVQDLLDRLDIMGSTGLIVKAYEEAAKALASENMSNQSMISQSTFLNDLSMMSELEELIEANKQDESQILEDNQTTTTQQGDLDPLADRLAAIILEKDQPETSKVEEVVHHQQQQQQHQRQHEKEEDVEEEDEEEQQVDRRQVSTDSESCGMLLAS